MRKKCLCLVICLLCLMAAAGCKKKEPEKHSTEVYVAPTIRVENGTTAPEKTKETEKTEEAVSSGEVTETEENSGETKKEEKDSSSASTKPDQTKETEKAGEVTEAEESTGKEFEAVTKDAAGKESDVVTVETTVVEISTEMKPPVTLLDTTVDSLEAEIDWETKSTVDESSKSHETPIIPAL